MSVSILYYKVTPEKFNSVQQSELIARWIDELPIEKQQKIRKLHRRKDQLLSLAGLQLLKRGITEFLETPFVLKQLQFPAQGKPFLKGNIDFNISHSGDIACCIISDSMEVGIDIERLRPVTANTMDKFLAKNAINPAGDAQHQFFNLWTINEAIIKAANHGSIFNMNAITLEQHGGYYLDKFWYFYPADIVSEHGNKEYTCHIACSEEIHGMNLIKAKQIYKL